MQTSAWQGSQVSALFPPALPNSHSLVHFLTGAIILKELPRNNDILPEYYNGLNIVLTWLQLEPLNNNEIQHKKSSLVYFKRSPNGWFISLFLSKYFTKKWLVSKKMDVLICFSFECSIFENWFILSIICIS